MQWRGLVERSRLLRRAEEWLPKVVEVLRELYPDAEIYLIGSLARGEAVAASDVDILVVTRHPPETHSERARVKVLVEERAGLLDLGLIDLHYALPWERDRVLRRAGRYRRLA